MSDEKKHDVSEKHLENIFKSIQYYCIGNIDEKIEKLLNERGAKKDGYLSQMVTHVIADDDSNEEFSEAKELFELPVVTSRWVELSARCNTLLPLNAFNPETKQLFSGVVACPSRLTKEDSNMLWAVITFHGGQCQLDLGKHVTHLITTRPEGVLLHSQKHEHGCMGTPDDGWKNDRLKCRAYVNREEAKYECAIKHDAIKIVTPDWVQDCITLKAKIDETKYHPKLLILTPPKEPTPPPPPKPPTPVSSTHPVQQPQGPVDQIPVPAQPHTQLMGGPRFFAPNQALHQGHLRSPHLPPHSAAASQPLSASPRAPLNHPHFPQMDQSTLKTMGMPPRPENLAAREAIARMVNNRIQHSVGSVPESPEGPVMGMHQRPPISLPQHVMSGPRGVGPPPPFPPHMAPNMSAPGVAPPQGMMFQGPRHSQFHPVGMQQQQQQQQRAPGFMPRARFPSPGMPPRSMPPSNIPPGNVPPMPVNLPQGVSTPPRNTPPALGSGPPTGKMSPRGGGASNSPVRSTTPTGTQKTSRNNSRSNTPTGARTLRNITNGAEDSAAPVKQNKIQQIMSSITRSPRSTNRPNQYQNKMSDEPRYYGHDEVDRVPGELCLLGCIFYITDYPKSLTRKELEIWQLVIEQHGGIVDPSYSNRVTHILCEHQKSDVYQMAIRDNKRVVTAFWLNDVLVQRKMCPPWQALHFPSLYTDFKPGKDQVIAVSGYEEEERVKVKQMVQLIGAKYTGYMTRANTVLLCKKTEGAKYQKANEWRIPVVNTRWLTDIVTGSLVALKANIPLKYQMFSLGEEEFKVDPVQVQPWLNGWRVPVKVPKESWKKFTPSSVKNSPAEAESNKRKSPVDASQSFPEPKKARMVPDVELPSLKTSEFPSPKIMITGLSANETEKHLEGVRRLGGKLASCSSECTHLIAPQVCRTVKFLTCISCCRFIVGGDWIEDSVAQGRFLDEDRYLLSDKKGEGQLGCNIRESLTRAKSRKLFENFTFYLTPGVQPSRSVMREVIENAGGRLVKNKPAARTVANGKNEKGEQTYIIITSDNDIHLCKDYFAKNIGVFNAEFVLSGVLRQEVDYHLYRMEKT